MGDWEGLSEQWHCIPPHIKQPDPASTHTAVCWTGGKDSHLALLKARQAGFVIDLLITFSPPGKEFYAHDKRLILAQSRALEVPHRFLDIPVGGDYRQSYINALKGLKEETDIRVVVSGDLALVGSMKVNWMRDCCEGAGLAMLCPLWGADRRSVLIDCLHHEMHVVFSCVKTPWFDSRWIGREINLDVVGELQALVDSAGLDLCGENGEYHTMVLACSLYKHPLVLQDMEARVVAGRDGESDTWWYMSLSGIDIMSSPTRREEKILEIAR